MTGLFRKAWCAGWLLVARVPGLSGLARRIARGSAGQYKERRFLGGLTRRPWLSPYAEVSLRGAVRYGHDVFVGDGCVLSSSPQSGELHLADGVTLWKDVIVELGPGGSLSVGEGTYIQPGVILTAFGRITIGRQVQIAPRCAFYPYSHQFQDLTRPVREQPLSTKGGITVEDDVWLGFGVVLLDGVTLGRGSVIGAGSVVTKSVEAYTIVGGNPARRLGSRLASEEGDHGSHPLRG